jgi:site-specific recombinase XerD
MTRKTESSPGTTSLERVVAHALRHLAELGYSTRTVRSYRISWCKLLEFAKASKRRAISPELVSRFFAHQGITPDADPAKLRWSQVELLRALRILTEFAEGGSFRRHRKRLPEPSFPKKMGAELSAYERFCGEHLGHRGSTIWHRRRVIVQFLQFVTARGVFSLRGVRTAHISDFLGSLTRLRTQSLAPVVGALRSFVRYLCMRGVLQPKAADELAPFRLAKDRRLPSVWPAKAVEELLAAVDRRAPQGKRDYAVLLLASRFGLRPSDIRTLRIDDIHWSDGRIDLRQSKTSQPLTLPLRDDVAEALIDYLRNGRPTTSYREVFLKARPPVEPLGAGNSLASIVATYVGRVKTPLPPGTQRGLRSLRHTLATRLLEAGESLETIAGILGHTSIESTRVYTSLDLDALRCVALDLEEVVHD